MNISEHIGVSALCEQCAEECTELAQASLKLARKLRNDNPTPKSMCDIKKCLTEEIADVLVCIDAIYDSGIVDKDSVNFVKGVKLDRWMSRIKEGETC